MGSIAIDDQLFPSAMPAKNDPRYSIKTPVTDSSALDAERVTLTINNLTINGFASQESKVANFRNIQYARFAARWHQAMPVDPTKEKGVIDATQWGPRPPQPIDVLHDATRHLYPRMSTFDRQSEFECLNLNIYGPKDALKGRTRGLPVLVWIHGGAFVYGDGGCEFDGQYLVRRSIDLGEPILVVGLNYRLGVLGFLSSKELREEAHARGEVGYNNLGLHDQRVALQWIQKNIHYFGGDGSRLTVAGESAGACSILAHLRGQVPLFQNAFVMSPAMLVPAPLDEVQENFDRLVAGAGLSDAPAGQQLSALRSMHPMEVHDLISSRRNTISVDSEFFIDYSDEAYEEIRHMPSWVQRVVVGEAKQENILFAQRWAAMSTDEMYNEWINLYPDPSYGQEVLSAYGVSKNPTHAELMAGHVAYTSDTLFGKTVQGIAKTHLQAPHPANPKVYYYSFDQPDILSPNPIFYNGAYHSEDNAFLFYFPQVTGPTAPLEFRKTAEVYNGAILKVINGKEPWEDTSVARRFMSINAEESGMKAETEGKYKKIWEKLVNTPERLEMFMRGIDLLYRAMGFANSLPADVHRH